MKLLPSFCVLGLAVMIPFGCSAKSERIGGVSGLVELAGKPLPAETTLTFAKPDSGAAFVAYTDGSGHYTYSPATGVPIAYGKYKVSLTPPGAKTIQKNGFTIRDPHAKDVKLNVDKKYLNTTTTPLEVELTGQSVVFDIKM